MAGRLRLIAMAKPPDRPAELEKMEALGRMVLGRWASQPEADEACDLLLRGAVVAGQMQKAIEYAERVRPDSPRRGELELAAGRLLWAVCLRASRSPRAERPAGVPLETMVAAARRALDDGIQRSRLACAASGRLSPALWDAVLLRTEMALEVGDTLGLGAWLEDPLLDPVRLLVRLPGEGLWQGAEEGGGQGHGGR